MLNQHVVQLLSALQRAHNDVCYSTRDGMLIELFYLLFDFMSRSCTLSTVLYEYMMI